MKAPSCHSSGAFTSPVEKAGSGRLSQVAPLVSICQKANRSNNPYRISELVRQNLGKFVGVEESNCFAFIIFANIKRASCELANQAGRSDVKITSIDCNRRGKKVSGQSRLPTFMGQDAHHRTEKTEKSHIL